MNLFTLNGNTLNGSRLVGVAAAATFTCAATIAASGTRIQDALAPVSGVTSFVAQPTHTHKGQVSPLMGEALVFVTATHNHSVKANISASAGIQGFVARYQTASAFITGSASALMIPASVLGSSNISGNSTLVATGTQILPGHSVIGTAAYVVVTGSPTVTRYVTANAGSGSGSLRAEPTINGIAYSYANLGGSADISIIESGLTKRMAFANINVAAVSNAIATHRQMSYAFSKGMSALVNAEPYITVGNAYSFLINTASFVAEGLIGKSASALVSSGSTVSPRSSVKHGSTKAMLSGSADLTVTSLVIRGVVGKPIVGKATMNTVAAVTRYCFMDAIGSGFVQASAVRRIYGEASPIKGSSSFSAQPDITIRQASAPVMTSATFTAEGWIVRYAISNLIGSSDFAVSAVRTVYPSANILGSISINADTIANGASFDPPERTFYSLLRDIEYVRPFIETEFWRLA